MSEKELRFIDPTSFTLLNVSINFVIVIVVSIIALIVSGIMGMIAVVAMFIPTVIFGTLMLDISSNFLTSILYNEFTKKLNCIKLDITEDGEIKKISPIPTALMLALIITIIALIFYLMCFLLIPIVGYYLITIMMYSGQLMNAMIISQYCTLLITPLYVVIGLIAIFVASFVTVLIETVLYNLLTNSIGGAVVELKTEDGLTSLESINPVKTATIFAVIDIVLSIIIGLTYVIMSKNYIGFVSQVIGGVIGTFVVVLVFAYLYNILSKKLGKIKVELI
ncbi:MAG: hypothetical protein MJ209_03000 [archaeon]|nr:hypothetical protein [archaeon]